MTEDEKAVRDELHALCAVLAGYDPSLPSNLLHRVEAGDIYGDSYEVVIRPEVSRYPCGCFYGWASVLARVPYQQIMDECDLFPPGYNVIITLSGLEWFACSTPACQKPDYDEMNNMAKAATWIREWINGQ